MPYAIVFSSLLLISQILKKRNELASDYHVVYYLVVIVILCLFNSLRGIGVGADTAVYKYHFETICSFNFVQVFERYRLDSGFYFFTWLLSKYIGDFQFYLFVIALLYIIPVIQLIRMRSKYPILSIFLFFCFGLYTFSFSTIRQTIAISFCVIAYIALDKSRLKSIIIFAIGVAFHYSAIIFLPYFIIHRLPFKRSVIGILITGVAVSFFLSDGLIPYFTQVVDFSGSNKTYLVVSTGGIGMILFLFFVFIVGATTVITQDQIEELSELKRNVLYIYSALVVFIVSRYNLAVMRLYYYYFIFIIIAIPNILSNTKNPDVRHLLKILFILVALYFLFFQVFADPYAESRRLLPYYFFWQ